MNRRDAQRRFDQILVAGDSAIRDLRSLANECGPLAMATAAGPSWRREAVEAFVVQLQREAAAGLPEAVSAESRERLDTAILQGPAALAALRSELADRVREAGRPLAELKLLRSRLQCQKLRRRCLEHLDSIFGAQRAQP
jgi:hypothetical protein